jgi:integrase
MREEWIDWRRRMIVIPGSQHCISGRDGDICGSCRQAAKQMAEHNEDITQAEAEKQMWRPKTSAAAREVPFDVSPRAELVIERYFDRFDEFQTSQSGLGRRVKSAAEHADALDPDEIYPHCLRATAATRFASRGLDVIALQAMFGWANLSTAHNYIRRSGENTARAIRDIQL